MAETKPYETLLPIRCAQEIADNLIGRTVYCAWFRIESRGDGTYDLTVSEDSADGILNRLDQGTLWEGPPDE